MTAESSGADEVLCKSNKEVPELLRAVETAGGSACRAQAAASHAPGWSAKTDAG